METIKINNGESDFAANEVEAGVALVKAAVGHLDRDILNIVLLSAIVENCHHHAKQSDEYKHAAEQFGMNRHGAVVRFRLSADRTWLM